MCGRHERTMCQGSDLVRIASLNGEFKKSYGVFVGSLLYLRTIGIAGRPTSGPFKTRWLVALLGLLVSTFVKPLH